MLQNETNFIPTGSQVPGQTPAQATNLLYAGEHFDADSQQYYNRARWYTPLNGRFNRVDPYSGNSQDPQSLHKYAYCHNNPINATDPSGMMSYIEVSVVLGVMALIGSIVMGPLHQAMEQTQNARVAAYQADAVSFLSDGLKTQMERDFLEVSDPDLRGMTESFYHELGNGQRVVTYQSYQAKANVLQGINLAFHSAQIGSVALGVTGGLATKVVWSKPHPPSNPAHWQTITQNAVNKAAKGEAKAIYTHRYLSTITNGRFKARMAPDIAEVLPNGKLRIIEVVSPKSQTYNELLKKGWKYKQVLGDHLDYYDVINIGELAP